MKFYRTEEQEISLNLAPLIDVVFLLLIFFMVTTTFDKKSAIDLTLPEASSQKTHRPEFTIQIVVSQSGEIFIESDQTRFNGISDDGASATETRKNLSNNIQQAIDLIKKQNPGQAAISPTIIIEADKATSHGRIIQLMDAISRLGINNIQFSVVPDQS